MRRLLGWFWVASLAVVVLPSMSDAFGRRGGCRECGPAPCYSPAPVCAVPVVPAPAPAFETRTVTYQKPVWKDKTIEEVVVTYKPREEKFTYEVMVPRTTVETKTVKVSRQVVTEEPYTAKVAYPVHTTEKRPVVQMKPNWKDVEFTYTVNVAKFRPVVRTVPTCTYEVKHITVNVPVCRVVPQVCTDHCGNCYTVCRTVIEHQPVTKCISVPVHGTREVTVNECYYEPETRKGVRRVCEYERIETVIDVPVCTVAYKDVTLTRRVCNWVSEDREVSYNVCNWVKESREGVKIVHDRVENKVSRNVKICEYETVTETIQVPVCAPVAHYSCFDGYISGCGGRGRRCR